MKPFRHSLLSIVGVLLMLGASATQAAPIFATADVDGGQEVPVVLTQATGEAKLSYDPSTGLLDFALAVEGIGLADITFPSGGLAFGGAGPVHLHNAVTGVNGGIVVPFPDMLYYTATSTGFSLEATGVDLSAVAFVEPFEQLVAAGAIYVNVHTLSNGGGEIRGQFAAVPEPTALGLLCLGMLGLFRRRQVRH